MLKFRIAIAALALLVLPGLAFAAPITIDWWQTQSGYRGEQVNIICEGFNKTQIQFKEVPTYKGNYADTMNAGLTAFL